MNISQVIIVDYVRVVIFLFGCLCRQFFTASVFTKLLQMDPYGRISIMQFFNYVMRKVWLHQTRIGLSLYDVAGQGYLKESVRMHISNALTGWGLSYIKISYKAVIIKSMENKVDGEFFFHWFMYIHCSNLRNFFFFFAGFRKLYSRTYSNTASGKSLYLAGF